MQRVKKIFILSLLAIGLALPAWAKGPGTTSANFLKVGVGARATALGEAYTALVDDASALYWNPAALANMENSEFFTAYNSYLVGVSQGYIALSFPSLGGNLGIGANYMDMGKFEGYNQSGNPTGNFGATDSYIFLGYGKKLSGGWSLGISLGSLSDKIKDDTKSCLAGTVGVLKEIGGKYRLGAAAQNLGQNLGKDPLPLTFKIGGAAKFSSLTLSADACLPNDNDAYFCLGLEWNLMKAFALRAGYRTGRDEGSGLSAGLGFKVGKFAFDYAFIPYGDLGDTHRVSLKIGF